MFAKQLSVGEIQAWIRFMEAYSVTELRDAFDHYIQEGRYFPKPRDIGEHCDNYRLERRTAFQACGNCDAGWLRVFSGQTVGSDDNAGPVFGTIQRHPVDPKIGGVRRCECFLQWARGE